MPKIPKQLLKPVTRNEVIKLHPSVTGAIERANALSSRWEGPYLIGAYAHSLLHTVDEVSGKRPVDLGWAKLNMLVSEAYRVTPGNQAVAVQYTVGERVPIGAGASFSPKDLKVFASDQKFFEPGLTPAQALELKITGKTSPREGDKVWFLVPGGAPVPEEILPELKLLTPELKATLVKSSSVEVEVSRSLADLFKPKDPIPGSVPTDRQILEGLQRFIKDLEKPERPVLKRNGPSWRSGREDEPWQSASAETAKDLQNLVDSPLPAGSGGIEPPPMLAYKLSNHEVDEETRQIWANMVEYANNMNQAFARLNRWLSQGLPKFPPSRQPQGPGPVTAPVTFSSTALVKAAKKLRVSTADIAPFEAAFALVAAATPELAAFYKPLCEHGFDDYSVHKLRNLFGHFRLGASPLSMGDLVLVRDDLMGLERWVVVVEPIGAAMKKAVIHQADDSFEVGSITGTPLMAWSPTPRLALDPASQIGSFWGRGVAKMLKILTYPDLRSPGEFVVEAIKGTSYEKVVGAVEYSSDRFPAFLNAIRPEMHRFTPQLPAHPWSLVFTGKDEEIGVYLPDGRVLGARGYTFQYFTWAQFDAQWVWYPHA